jgi:hypothetical protein
MPGRKGNPRYEEKTHMAAPGFVATTSPLFGRKQYVCASCGENIYGPIVYREGKKRYHRRHHPRLGGNSDALLADGLVR